MLTFVEDHGLMQNCEAVGADDSGLYPARAPTPASAATARLSPGRTTRSIRLQLRELPLQPGDPLLRLAPQRKRVLGHGRKRHPAAPQQHLRQRARLHDRRLHGARAPGLPAGLGPGRVQQLLLEQLRRISVRSQMRRQVFSGEPVPDRRRALDRRRQRQRRSQQPLLGQLAARHDGVRGSRPARLRARGRSTPASSPAATRPRFRPRPRTGTSSTAT